ncbi:MAG TPA: serine hydrolase [Candidatus Acidoferrum sp.]|nr:serine hydrolase [Candidatus Acidoferrum sp.]
MIAFLLAAIPPVPTPPSLFTPTPAPISERAVLESGLGDAAARAKTLGGTLGVTIVDITTGATSSIGGDANLPMAGVQHLPIALLVYRAIDAGHLAMTRDVHGLLSRMLDNDDDGAADTLLDQLGGSEAANAQLRAIGYQAIFLVPNDAGYATPAALAGLLSDIVEGKLLTGPSTKALLAQLSGVGAAPARLRAGFSNVALAHVPGTLSGGDGTNIATNDVGVASVNGRTFIVAAMLQGAHGSDASRDAIIAAIGQLAVRVTSLNP